MCISASCGHPLPFSELPPDGSRHCMPPTHEFCLAIKGPLLPLQCETWPFPGQLRTWWLFPIKSPSRCLRFQRGDGLVRVVPPEMQRVMIHPGVRVVVPDKASSPSKMS